MIAIISDIHANIEALNAVLEDIEAKGCKKIYCLGDVIGYGPNPRECLELAQNWDIVLMGNHELALIEGAESFNKRAAKAIEWTRNQLFTNDDVGKRNKAMISKMPQKAQEGSVAMVHASPRQPVKEYLLPQDVKNVKKLSECFSITEHVCLNGHTHHPGVFLEGYTFEKPSEILNLYLLDDSEKALINVGSVGQSRDGDNRACYVTFDGEAIVYRRVKYDFYKTMEKIRAVPELDNSLADRLAAGR